MNYFSMPRSGSGSSVPTLLAISLGVRLSLATIACCSRKWEVRAVSGGWGPPLSKEWRRIWAMFCVPYHLPHNNWVFLFVLDRFSYSWGCLLMSIVSYTNKLYVCEYIYIWIPASGYPSSRSSSWVQVVPWQPDSQEKLHRSFGLPPGNWSRPWIATVALDGN